MLQTQNVQNTRKSAMCALRLPNSSYQFNTAVEQSYLSNKEGISEPERTILSHGELFGLPWNRSRKNQVIFRNLHLHV